MSDLITATDEATESAPTFRDLFPDGHVDEYGEKIVYEYDEEGNFAGWHKEPAA